MKNFLSKISKTEKNKLKKSEILTRRSLNYRSLSGVVTVVVLLGLLIGRLAYLQLIVYADYREDALDVYTTEYKIPADRGVIFDRNLDVLADSVTVETVFISPPHIDGEAEAELIAEGLSNILSIDKESILEKTKKKGTQYQIIKRNIELEQADEIRRFILGNELQKCVHLEESSKRVYLYDTLASHVIGFSGADNQGLIGLESFYDKKLKGIDGKVLRGKDGRGNDLSIRLESYVSPVDGTSLVLTIDMTIQSILEKYLKEAYIEHNPQNRAMGVIMDVNTGEILALSVLPDFNLNDPYVLDEKSQALLDAFVGSEEDKSKYKIELLNRMWNNKVVSEPYETGSTFKVLTSSMALDTNSVKLTDTFHCSSAGIVVGGANIHCHKHGGHGTQTFVEALQNSCNPSFVNIALRIGTNNFVKYMGRFGFFEKTGIDYAGEASTIWHKKFNELELAVSGFGQTFKVTPIAHIRALAAAANGGNLVTPHLVKAYADSNGKIKETLDYGVTRRVISEATSKQILEIMYGGITHGSTKNASVEGYKISAKTGTSQKRDQQSDGSFTPYVSSCIAYAPADDPQIVIFIAIDEPKGQSHEFYGGLVAAPVISKVLSEVLSYMKVPKTEVIENKFMVTVDDLRGKTVEEAQKLLKAKKLEYKVVGDGDIVLSQLPLAGETISEGGKVILYTSKNAPEGISVPNVIGLDPEKAAQKLIKAGLNIKAVGAYDSGSGSKAVSQNITAGSAVAEGAVIEVEFKNYEVTD
ncbi:MAG: penicillin-binding transpeptidase domain-containing protein [Eubacteriales bacterium]|nr:penicillin-binding transpeptidase domain-containing protein [Eubacteriales bacterium]MDD4476043.1 penicillin-binding transpeptidase domain-containing protein [Eubacteriales bacterium]